jgi:AcrR family transcriptional regulator
MPLRKEHQREHRAYHHGDLKRALMEEALVAIRESGPAALSLRDVARRAGVSHAAPVHHFGDKAGLLTAIAAEGFRKLATALKEADERTGSFREVGVAYVRFALENRSYFEVMFRPELYHSDDPELAAASRASSEQLQGYVGEDQLQAAVAAWSLVHGLATLWLNGNLPPALGDDPEQIARSVLGYLFQPAGSGTD